MRITGLLIVAALALSGCDTPQPQVAATANVSSANAAGANSRGNPNGSGHIKFLGGDGSTLAKAVVITGARGEIDGVQSEYDWLAKFRPGWSPTNQALVHSGGRVYDRLNITKAGQKAEIWFDISGYFGRF